MASKESDFNFFERVYNILIPEITDYYNSFPAQIPTTEILKEFPSIIANQFISINILLGINREHYKQNFSETLDLFNFPSPKLYERLNISLQKFIDFENLPTKDIKRPFMKEINKDFFDIFRIWHILGNDNSDLLWAWSDVYELHISASEGKNKGVYYTPREEIQFMIHRTLYYLLAKEFDSQSLGSLGSTLYSLLKSSNKTDMQRPLKIDQALYSKYLDIILNCSIIDISCGSGRFLTKYLDYLLSFELIPQINTDIKPINLFQRLFGIDILPSAVDLAKQLLLLTCILRFPDIKFREIQEIMAVLNNNIVCSDSLTIESVKSLQIKNNNSKFDMIIGNPPYLKTDLLNQKEKLINLIKSEFKGIEISIPKTFDYYIYFFYFSFFYAKPSGIICLLTSNSWLDVKYGYPFQRFLLQNSRILEIIENDSLRSFKAEINTVISILSPIASSLSQIKFETSLRKTNRGERKSTADLPQQQIRFILLKKNFDYYIENYKINGQSNWDTYKHNPITGDQSGIEWHSFSTEFYRLNSISPETLAILTEEGGHYELKWGSVILRGTISLFLLIVNKRDCFCKMEDLCDLKTGVYTGINDFFYITDSEAKSFGITNEFLVPIIRDSKDVSAISLSNPDSVFLLKIPAIPKKELALKCKGLVKYIEAGEKKKSKLGQKSKEGVLYPDISSVKSRKYWYSIPENSLIPTNLFMQYIANTRFYCPYSISPILSDRSFHRLYPKEGIVKDSSFRLALAAILNSSIQMLFVFSFGRYNLGAGALKFETMDAKKVLTLDITKFSAPQISELSKSFEKMMQREPVDVFQEFGIDAASINSLDEIKLSDLNILEDRKQIDGIIFGILDIENEEEKAQIYKDILNLVMMRKKKVKNSSNNS